ncbi:MAG: phosphatase PAP2 family protein [Candidatus ainarchaeum sp.]|nr:phosphatase PAP2 family protein [Candidatus ainarchaeum sp.]
MVMMNIDVWLFQAINGLAGKSVFWDNFMYYFSIISPYLFVILLIFAYVYYKDSMIFVKALFVIGLCFLFKGLLGLFFFRDRPFVALKNVNFIGNHDPTSSMPSGHTMFSFGAFFPTLEFKNWLTWLMLFLAILTAFSRVYLGYHYPSDILVGILVSGFFYLVVYYIFEHPFVKKKIDKIRNKYK